LKAALASLPVVTAGLFGAASYRTSFEGVPKRGYGPYPLFPAHRQTLHCRQHLAEPPARLIILSTMDIKTSQDRERPEGLVGRAKP